MMVSGSSSRSTCSIDSPARTMLQRASKREDSSRMRSAECGPDAADGMLEFDTGIGDGERRLHTHLLVCRTVSGKRRRGKMHVWRMGPGGQGHTFEVLKCLDKHEACDMVRQPPELDKARRLLAACEAAPSLQCGQEGKRGRKG